MAQANLLIRIAADLQGFDRKMNTAVNKIRRFGRDVSDVGRSMTVGFSLPAVAAGGAAVNAFAKFDGAMKQSLAIMGDVSDTMKNDMSRAARQVAKDTTFMADEAGRAYFFLASAGLDAEASLKALPLVARFAQAGMFDLARATDLLTDAQSALGLTIRDDATKNMQQMARVSDVLVKANTLANASVAQFSESLTTKAGAAARVYGRDMEEVVAVLAAMADQGIKGADAGTQYGIVMRDLTTKALKNKEAFNEFGVAVFDNNNKIRHAADIVADLEDALDGLSDAEKKATLLALGFSDRSVNAIQALLGLSDVIRQYDNDLRQAGSTTKEVSDKQLTAFSAKLQLLRNSINDIGISVGENLAPTVEEIANRIREMAPAIVGWSEGFAKLDTSTKSALIGLAGIATAAPLAVWAIGTLVDKMAVIISIGPKAKGALAAIGLTVKNLRVGVLGLAAAWSGWKLGEWAAKLQFTKDVSQSFFDYYGDKIPGMVQLFDWLSGASKIAADSQEQLANSISKLRSDALDRGIGVPVRRASESLEEYSKRLNEAVRAQSDFDQGTAEGTAEVAETAEAIRQTALALMVQEEATKRGNAGFQSLIGTLTDLASAHEVWGQKMEYDASQIENLTFHLGQLERQIDLLEQQREDMFRLADANFPTRMELTPEKSPYEVTTEKRDKKIDDMLKESERRSKDAAQRAAQHWQTFQRQVSTIFTDLSRRVADLIFQGGKLTDVFKEFGKALLRMALERQFSRLVGLVTDLVSKSGVLQKIWGALFGGIAGKAAGKVLGGVAGSAAGSAASGAIGVGASAASGAVGAAGSVGSTVSSTVSGVLQGIVGPIASLGSMISGIIGNFQMAGMNNKLGDLRQHTLQTANQLIFGMQPVFNEYLPYLKELHTAVWQVREDLVHFIGPKLDGGGKGVTINVYGSADANTTAEEVVRILRLSGAVPAT